jgi:hypothetical protein
MKRTNTGMIALCFLLIMQTTYITAQDGYSDYRTLTSKISALGKVNPAVCSVRSLVRTEGGKEIWLLTIGTGDAGTKPGIAVLGGIEGNHLLGREIALGVAQSLVNNASSQEINQLLQKVTFYIIPDVSPDASEQFFASVKYERLFNARPVDNDRDFTTNEDPFDDLDGNGIITLLRIEDPSGRFVKSSEDERIMVEADIAKGETGKYIVISEGIDNDGDDSFNEDGPGGVCFNRNFTFNYEEFGPGAGLHPVSEPETKAVADFLYDRFNIYAVISFGPEDNLGQPMKSQEQPRTDRRITSIMKSDEAVNKLVSDKYHEITGLKGAPQGKPSPGNFMEWAYFHYGRYSFSSPGWWFPADKGKNAGAEFLKYAGSGSDVFVDWKEIAHPGFPGRKTEAGGIKPFVSTNPPSDSVGPIVERHYRFVTEIAAMHPELVFSDVKVENAGGNLFRVSLKIVNMGVFATMAEAGEMNMWTRLPRISLETGKNQEVLSGRKVQRIGRLTGGQSAEFSWLISGTGQLKITAGAVNTGTINTSLQLK